MDLELLGSEVFPDEKSARTTALFKKSGNVFSALFKNHVSVSIIAKSKNCFMLTFVSEQSVINFVTILQLLQLFQL